MAENPGFPFGIDGESYDYHKITSTSIDVNDINDDESYDVQRKYIGPSLRSVRYVGSLNDSSLYLGKHKLF